jgi:serine/threonine protein kinase
LLPGGDLRFHITRHKKRFFSELQTKFFVSCIVLALKYIHSNKIIHRDIKPENLVFDLRGFLHVTDFGIAKFFSSVQRETSGTPGYMAPEVMKGKSHTFAVDYFAVGVIAYELMMGRRPYVGKSKKEIREQIMSKQVFVAKEEIPLGWSDEAADFVNRCLERKDVKRIGYENENEVLSHVWFKDVDWKAIERKKVACPFEIDGKENFDKKFCEGVEKVGVNTSARYEEYKNNEKYNDLFQEFTFMNINLEIKLNSNNIKNNNIESRIKIQKSYSNNNMLINNNNYNNLILTHRHNMSNVQNKIRIPSANNVQRHHHYNSLNLHNNNQRQLLLDGKITENNKFLSHQNLIPKAKSKRKNSFNEKVNNYYLSNNNDITPLNKNNHQTKIPI